MKYLDIHPLLYHWCVYILEKNLISFFYFFLFLCRRVGAGIHPLAEQSNRFYFYKRPTREMPNHIKFIGQMILFIIPLNFYSAKVSYFKTIEQFLAR